MFLNVLMRPFIPTFLEDVYGFRTFLIGLFGSLTFAGSALLGVLIGRVSDKLGNEVAVATCLSLTAVSLTLLQLTPNRLFLAPVFFIIGTTYTPWPLMNAKISSLLPRKLRGRWIAISQTASMSAAFVAPYVGGSLYMISPNFPFIITIVGSAILLGLVQFIPSGSRV
jgi:MFS family permease